MEFFLNALLSKGKAGAISTSSRYVVRDVLKHVKGPLGTVVEYGPGDGVVTQKILKLMAPEGRLIVIESDPEFTKVLRKINDPRIEVIQGNVEEVLNSEAWKTEGVDLVLSSIPLSFLTPVERGRLIERTNAILAPHGSCIVFHQYSTLIKETLGKYFSRVTVEFEPRNIFPCFIIVARK